MKDVSAQQALEMLADVSGVADLAPETEFAKLKLDSLMLIEWVSMLEESLDADLDIRHLDMRELESMSVSDVIEALRKRIVGA
jgi:acyl carrier protein